MDYSATEDEDREPPELWSYEAISAALAEDRAEWEARRRARPVAGPVIEINGNGGPAESAQNKEAKYMDWLRALRDDDRIHGLAMAAVVTAVGARCQASTGALTFPPRKMAKDWGMSDQTIRSALKELEDSGYIRRIDRGPGKIQYWQLMLPESAEKPTEMAA